MIIAISGTSGLVGGALEKWFLSEGHQVIPLLRSDFGLGASHLAAKMEGVTSVVHLAGAPILKRWTSAYKEEIRNSRVDTTDMISEAIALMQLKPESFLCASAVGIYQAGQRSTEDKPVFGTDFLARVCALWEAAAQLSSPYTRVVNLRFGVVLAAGGGAMSAMLPLFKAGLGGRVASGKQPFPWIHLDDLLSAVEFVITHRQISGAVNMVAPGGITNIEFTRALSDVLRRPAFVPVPVFALRMVFGEGASTLFNTPEVAPGKLSASGFTFQYPGIRAALTDLL